MKQRLVIIQTTTPHYRSAFFQYLREVLGEQFELYAGERYFEASITSDFEHIEAKKLKNHFLLKKKVLFQTGHWHLLFSKATLVMELNPRILSNWIFLILRRLFARKTILWGHAWPRTGKDAPTDTIRHWMRRMASAVIVYTHKQQRELQHKMPNKAIWAAPNALYRSDQMSTEATNREPRHLIYVGRLTAAKKPFFMVKGFAKALGDLPKNVHLWIVGAGPEREAIAEWVTTHEMTDRIQLLGEISAYSKLKELYNQSLFSVSPGYVGLSITQSLGFGVPMLVSKKEHHSPEIEALEEGKNAIFFETDNEEDFTQQLIDIYRQKDEWMAKRSSISKACAKAYSIEAMTAPFISLTERKDES